MLCFSVGLIVTFKGKTAAERILGALYGEHLKVGGASGAGFEWSNHALLQSIRRLTRDQIGPSNRKQIHCNSQQPHRSKVKGDGKLPLQTRPSCPPCSHACRVDCIRAQSETL